MLEIVTGADRKEHGLGCAFLTSFIAEKLLYLDLFFLRDCLFLWRRSMYVVNTCKWKPGGNRGDIPGGTHVLARPRLWDAPKAGQKDRRSKLKWSHFRVMAIQLTPFNF